MSQIQYMDYPIGNNPTFYLYARPSFIEGVARLFDFGAALQEYNYSESPAEADGRAAYSDWLAVGDDLRRAFHQYERDRAAVER